MADTTSPPPFGCDQIEWVKVTCCAAPYQLEGALTDGRFFYFRERHGTAALTFSDHSITDAIDRQVFDHEGTFVECPMPLWSGDALATRVVTDLFAAALGPS